jgi:hypothetical protein
MASTIFDGTIQAGVPRCCKPQSRCVIGYEKNFYGLGCRPAPAYRDRHSQSYERSELQGRWAHVRFLDENGFSYFRRRYGKRIIENGCVEFYAKRPDELALPAFLNSDSKCNSHALSSSEAFRHFRVKTSA